MGTRTASRSALARKARTDRALRELSSRATSFRFSDHERLAALAAEVDDMTRRYPDGHRVEQLSVRDRGRFEEMMREAARIVGVDVRGLMSMASGRRATSPSTENRSEVLREWQRANRVERR